MRRTNLRRRLIGVSALALAGALGLGGHALAANVIRIDVSGTGVVTNLTISQDSTHNTNTITTTGAAGGARIPIRGTWNNIAVTQSGAGNVLKGSGLTTDVASTNANLTLSYGSAGAGGNNVHSLTIGNTTAPTDPTVNVTVVNTDPTNAANTITDALNGTSLTYTLGINGTNTTVSNTLSATGAVTASITANGGTAAAGNTITNNITGADSIDLTVTMNSNGNSVTNTSNSAGAKMFNVSLPTGSNGNTVVNDFTGGSGDQSSTLAVNSVTSRVNFNLAAAGAGTSSAVTLTDVKGAAGAAGKLEISQGGAGTSLSLVLNGNGKTMGTGLGTGGNSGVVITQASAGSVADVIITAAANGYTYSLTQ